MTYSSSFNLTEAVKGRSSSVVQVTLCLLCLNQIFR